MIKQENTGDKTVCFFYPSRTVGGAEFLFLRLAKVLTAELGYKVLYVDYLDGFARQSIGSENEVRFIDFNEAKKVRLPPGTVLITPLSSIIDVTTFLYPNTGVKCLFWSIHPNGLKVILNGYHKHKLYGRFLKKQLDYATSLDLILNKASLYFMDGPNFFIQKSYFRFESPNPKLLPIPYQFAETVTRPALKDLGHINLGWVGRLSEEKIYPLLNVLEHARNFAQATGRKISFHIFGEGNFGHLLDPRNYAGHLDLISYGTLVDSELKSALRAKVDMLFAMGTSALEAAGLKIPTILVDFSYEPIPLSNKFRWLYESLHYSLGDLYTHEETYQSSFEELIELIYDDGHYEQQADLCYTYSRNNHDIKHIAALLAGAADNARFDIQDLKKTEFIKFRIFGLLRRMKN